MLRKKKKKAELAGERLAWFELAFRLGMPVEKLQDEITYSEFEEWMEFFRIQRDRDEKLHWYLAQIAAEVRKSFVKNPASVKIKDFILKFSTGGELPANLTPGHKKHRIAMSKGAWLGAIGASKLMDKD